MYDLWTRIILAEEEKRVFLRADRAGRRYCKSEVRDMKKAAQRDPEAAIFEPDEKSDCVDGVENDVL